MLVFVATRPPDVTYVGFATSCAPLPSTTTDSVKFANHAFKPGASEPESTSICSPDDTRIVSSPGLVLAWSTAQANDPTSAGVPHTALVTL